MPLQALGLGTAARSTPALDCSEERDRFGDGKERLGGEVAAVVLLFPVQTVRVSFFEGSDSGARKNGELDPNKFDTIKGSTHRKKTKSGWAQKNTTRRPSKEGRR